jgi:hypothetical protein
MRLGRELTAAELVQVDTFEDLSRAQLDVVAKLAERDGILPSNYELGVVPSAEHGDVRKFVLNVGAFIANKFPASALPRLRMEPVYERELGRPLNEEERRSVESLQSLSPAQLAVATQLALKDIAYAMTYLSEVVKSARDYYDREMFAERLRSRAKATD